MVKRPLTFSFLVSLVSLVLVGVSPIQVPISHQDKIYSPYRDEIDKLLEDGMIPSKSAHLRELIKKNNEWFDENLRERPPVTVSSALDAWKQKSAYMSPVVMLIWGISFFFFYKREPNNLALLVLVFPVLLTLVGLMPLVETALIAFSVSAVWFWFVLNPLRSKD